MDTIKEYGKVGIITHLALSWSFFGGLYLFVNRSNQTDKLIRYLKLQDKIPKAAGAFAISGIIYKAVMPVRIAVSILAIPIVVKAFGIQSSSPPLEPAQPDKKEEL